MQAVAEKDITRLISLYRGLPPDSQDEVLDFADFLAHRRAKGGGFQKTRMEDVAGCLAYEGTPKTVQEMHDAIATGVGEKWMK